MFVFAKLFASTLEFVEDGSRSIWLYVRLVDLHRRETEAGTYELRHKGVRRLTELYELELAGIERIEEKRGQDKPEAA